MTEIDATLGKQVQLGYRQKDNMLVIELPIIAQPVSLYFPMTELIRFSGMRESEVLPFLQPEETLQHDANEKEFLNKRLKAFDLVDFTGKTVLDVGGYDGEFARIALDRGANTATVVDNNEFLDYGWRSPAHRQRVKYVNCDLRNWYNAADIVIFGNVLYHLSDPFGSMYHLRSLCKETMIMWTSTVDSPDPIFRFYDATDKGARAINGFFSVYFKPSEEGLKRLLARTGWKSAHLVEKHYDHLILLVKP